MRTSLVYQSVIDLIRNNRNAQRCHTFQEILIQQHTRRIHWRINKNTCRIRSNALTDRLYIILQTILFGQRHQDRFCLGSQHEVTITRISRIGQNHFTVRVAKQHQDQKDRGRRTGSDDNTIRIDGDSIFTLIKSGYFTTQFRIPQRVSIMCEMPVVGSLSSFRHTNRNVKVRLTDFQVDNVHTLFL